MVSESDLMNAWAPLVDALDPIENTRTNRLVRRVVGQDGQLIQDRSWSRRWNGNHPLLFTEDDGTGLIHVWVDDSGDMRIKSGKASNDTDGDVVGSQS